MQKLCKIKGVSPSLKTLDVKGDIVEVKAQESSVCLGGTLQHDLQWKAKLESGKEAILSILRGKVGCIEIWKYVGKNIPWAGKLG